MSIKQEAKQQRATTLYDAIASRRRHYTLKEVCELAGLNYNSITTNLPKLVHHGKLNAVSDELLDRLEAAHLELEANLTTTAA